MKLLNAIGLTAVYTAVLFATYLVHVWYLPVNVVFYAALTDALLATLIVVVIMAFLGRRIPLGGFEKGLLVTVWMLCGYAFAISVPTVLDRSLSFYILEKLDQRGGGIRQDNFAQVFTDEYISEFRLVDMRLTEQLESGTVVIENGCVKLTDFGRRLASVSRYFRRHLLPKKRLLAGEYSDALVDPFEGSSREPAGYECD